MQKEDISTELRKERAKEQIVEVFIIFLILIFTLYLLSKIDSYWNSSLRELEVGASIEEANMTDAQLAMIKVSGGSNKKDIENVKFIFTEKNGEEHHYITKEGTAMMSQSFEKNIFKWIFYKPEYKASYNYQIDAKNIAGLESFRNVEKIEVMFEYAGEEKIIRDTPVLDRVKLKR